MKQIEELQSTISEILKNVKISVDEEINKRVIELLIQQIIDNIKGFVHNFEVRAYKRGYQDCLDDINELDTDLQKKTVKVKFDSSKT
jgi:hypothetical protein